MKNYGAVGMNIHAPQSHKHAIVNISCDTFYHMDKPHAGSGIPRDDDKIAPRCHQVSAVLKQFPRDFQVFEVINCDGDVDKCGVFEETNVLDIKALHFDSPSEEVKEVFATSSTSTSRRSSAGVPGTAADATISPPAVQGEGTTTATSFCPADWLLSLPGGVTEQLSSMHEFSDSGDWFIALQCTCSVTRQHLLLGWHHQSACN